MLVVNGKAIGAGQCPQNAVLPKLPQNPEAGRRLVFSNTCALRRQLCCSLGILYSLLEDNLHLDGPEFLQAVVRLIILSRRPFHGTVPLIIVHSGRVGSKITRSDYRSISYDGPGSNRSRDPKYNGIAQARNPRDEAKIWENQPHAQTKEAFIGLTLTPLLQDTSDLTCCNYRPNINSVTLTGHGNVRAVLRIRLPLMTPEGSDGSGIAVLLVSSNAKLINYNHLKHCASGCQCRLYTDQRRTRSCSSLDLRINLPDPSPHPI